MSDDSLPTEDESPVKRVRSKNLSRLVSPDRLTNKPRKNSDRNSTNESSSDNESPVRAVRARPKSILRESSPVRERINLNDSSIFSDKSPVRSNTNEKSDEENEYENNELPEVHSTPRRYITNSINTKVSLDVTGTPTFETNDVI